jgi:hypothetical protein
VGAKGPGAEDEEREGDWIRPDTGRSILPGGEDVCSPGVGPGRTGAQHSAHGVAAQVKFNLNLVKSRVNFEG